MVLHVRGRETERGRGRERHRERERETETETESEKQGSKRLGVFKAMSFLSSPHSFNLFVKISA